MECKRLFNKETSVLYQNRYCAQENFDIIFTGLNDQIDYLRSVYNVKCPSFTHIETLVSKLKYIKGTVTSCSSIWIICSHVKKRMLNQHLYFYVAFERFYDVKITNISVVKCLALDKKVFGYLQQTITGISV